MTIFYFTSTGNSLAVAKKIGGEDAALVSIPQIIDRPDLSYKDDVIGVVYPIYGFGLPKMVRRFLEKVKWETDYAFAIGTYGNLPGAAARNTQFLARKQGLRLDYSTTLLMVDNYLPGFEVNDQIAKLPAKKTDANLAQIVADIADRKPLEATAGLGWRAITAAIKAGEAAFMNNTQNYIVDEKCTKCGTCAKVCPAANITVTDKVSFGNQCEWCLGCVHLCPKNALHMKNEKSGNRWRHPDVPLAEIIKSNDRTMAKGKMITEKEKQWLIDNAQSLFCTCFEQRRIDDSMVRDNPEFDITNFKGFCMPMSILIHYLAANQYGVDNSENKIYECKFVFRGYTSSHFYNEVCGVIVDSTIVQFGDDLSPYNDNLSCYTEISEYHFVDDLYNQVKREIEQYQTILDVKSLWHYHEAR